MPTPWRCAHLLIAVAPLVAGCSSVGGTSEPSSVPASVPPAAQGAVDASVSALARQLGVDPGSIAVVSVEATDWPDASLGCPAPGLMSAQVVTPGFVVVLDAQKAVYEYHTDAIGQQVATCSS
jgi:hypothetical protein